MGSSVNKQGHERAVDKGFSQKSACYYKAVLPIDVICNINILLDFLAERFVNSLMRTRFCRIGENNS